MVWGAFSASGNAGLVVIEGNRLDTNNSIFQQDNAAIHTFKLTKYWFKTKKKYWSSGLAYQVSRFKPKRKFVGNFFKKSIQK